MSICKTVKSQFINIFNLQSKEEDCPSNQGFMTTGKVHIGTISLFVFCATKDNMNNSFYGVEARYMQPLPYSHCTGTVVAACPELAI